MIITEEVDNTLESFTQCEFCLLKWKTKEENGSMHPIVECSRCKRTDFRELLMIKKVLAKINLEGSPMERMEAKRELLSNGLGTDYTKIIDTELEDD